MGLADAESAEHSTASQDIIITLVSCVVPPPMGTPRLSGDAVVRVKRGTRAFRIYQREEVREQYYCSYEVNPAYQARLESAGLKITGTGPNGEVRIVELPVHRFFFATLFQPQMSSAVGKPHPVITSFLEAASDGS